MNNTFIFHERMAGEWTPKAAGSGGAFCFDVEVECPLDGGALRDVIGTAKGTLTMEGWADAVPAEGSLSLSPFWKRRVRYLLAFAADDGRRYVFEGRKRIRTRTPIASWTTLPGTVRDEASGEVVADVLARFDLRRQLAPLLSSFRWSR